MHHLLLVYLIVFLPFTSLSAKRIQILNNCNFTTWAAIQSPTNPASGGFELEFNETKSFYVDSDWEGGKIWARTHCDKEMNCATGGCGKKIKCNGASGTPPFTMAQITLSGDAYDNKMDKYNVSLEYGFNVPILIISVNGDGKCDGAGQCSKDPNEQCKKELAVIRDGETVGCKPDCYNTSLAVCTGNPTAKMFKESCAGAMAHQYEDESATKTCKGGTYIIQFC